MYAGVKTVNLSKAMWSFFSKETILEGETLLFKEIGCNDTCVKYLNDKDNILDIAKLFLKCSKEKKALPRFRIRDPSEALAGIELVLACITYTMNQRNDERN